MNYYDTVIVGGGASGMMCAIALAKLSADRRILILERNDRLGKKLSATGNGQGNISNADMDCSHYFTTERDKVSEIISAYNEKALVADLEGLGGMFGTDENGRIYPTSMQASSVTDLLRAEIARHNDIEVALSARAAKACRMNGKFAVEANSKTYACKNLVLSAGGKAAKHFGTDGSAYALAEAFGHTVTELFPVLVQLKTPTERIRGMKGIRSDCNVSLYEGKELLKAVRGDLLFTEYGVSGNAVFKISSYLTKNNRLEIDFLPDVEENRLKKALQRKIAAYPDLPVDRLLCAIVNNSIARGLVRYCRIGGNEPCGNIPGLSEALASAVRSFPLEVAGTLGFDYAQTTRGGIPTEETDLFLMSKKCPNLYFTGEILNVDGECGGYNLQWAFSSAVRVARAIAGRCGG